MRTLESDDDVRELLTNRPATTQTYAVPHDVLRRVPDDTGGELREMTAAEVRELAEFLELNADELQGPLRAVDARCPACARQITFLDFVKTAIDNGHHEHGQLREVLAGHAGAWLTVRGQDGGRRVNCAACGEQLRSASDYSEYSSGSYMYA